MRFTRGHVPANKTHGMRKTRFYKIFAKAKARCIGKSDAAYPLYGGRGIKILWDSFEEFRDDMYTSYLDHAEKYGESNTSIERIENGGPYSKHNCRWATMEEQCNNRRTNRIVDFHGEIRTLAQWIKHLGLNRTTVSSRLHRGWPIEKALESPVTSFGTWSSKRGAHKYF